MALTDLLGDTEEFLNRVFIALDQDGIDVSKNELDHLCYRVETMSNYLDTKKVLLEHGTLLGESEINGRPIATYKLHEPIQYREREISVLEIPAPKEGKPYSEGLEHVEFVINESFEDFMSQHPNVDFNAQGADKPRNPDIVVKYDDFVVKFHHQALESYHP